MVGEVVADRYELEELVGTGGMSSVFKARDRLLDRNVALKILHQHYLEDEEYVERFRREARAVAQLSHPNIVTVIDRGEAEDRQYIVFELVEGENLKELVNREGPLPVAEALELAAGVARALAFAHQHGLVHRDVKPQNVLLNGDGRPKVTDFGIARSLDVQHGVTQTGTVLGTSNYIAPEQAAGERVDAQSDVYSLGVVLFELLTGDVPFEGENFVSVAMKHINEPPPSVLDRRGDVSQRLADAVDRALAKDPKRRFPSMDAFAAELEACLADLRQRDDDPGATMIVAPRGGRPKAARPRRRRSPAPLLVALAALLALGVLAAAVLALRGGSGGGTPTAAKTEHKAVALVGATSYDPNGDDEQEHSELVSAVADKDPATVWRTSTYHYGNGGLGKDGVGVVVDAKRPVALSELGVATDTPGFVAVVKSGSSPTGPFSVDSASRTVNAGTTFKLHGTTARYYLLWITRLPTESDHADVNEIVART